MTEARAESARPSWRRRLVTAVATTLLIAQCLAVAHFHPKLSSSIRPSTGGTLDEGSLCALCLFHQYSPGASSAAPSLLSSLPIGQIDLYAAQSWPLYTFNSYLPGRSPPVAA